jgi:5-methylcytosine-specific restriction endonuclease McrA
MKICKKCQKTKDIASFYKSSFAKDGLQSYCKTCDNLANKKYRIDNKEEISKKVQEYRLKNKGIYSVKQRQWRQENKDKVATISANRRSINKIATPFWLTEIHFQQIKWYYEAAEMFKQDTGDRYEVDHIHPLNGANFSGLHVPWNLRIIKSFENRSKGNRPPAEEAHLFWS